MRDLIELAERCEAAAPAMQGALIEEAWEVIAQASAPFRRLALAPADGFDNNAARFGAAMDARAYESAALMLVPDGWRPYSADMSIKNRVRWLLEGPKTKLAVGEDGDRCAGNDWYVQSVAATPALAITAACLRAIAGEGE